MTGTLNRSGVERARSRLLRVNHELVVLFIDIDHFKSLNDTYGHACGDQILRHLGYLLMYHSCGDDIVGRMGGDEFVLIAPHTGLNGAQKLADRIREAFQKNPPQCNNGEPPRITLSIGIAKGHKGEGYKQTTDRADKALRSAKESGRDRVEVIL